ncbi:MAG: response regulator, partial [Chromatocurvus sp.]
SREESQPTETTRIPDATLRRASQVYRILLVEDDELVRRYVQQQLRSLGYEVVSASAGAQALSLLRERTDIDLLFTDVVMPGGMSGRDLAEAAAKVRPGMPVLYTSGYSKDVITHGGRVDEGIDLLRKPYRREELAHRLADILGNDNH